MRTPSARWWRSTLFLDSRRQNIIDRIGEINQSLSGIPYDTTRHIQLEHQATSHQDVREFGSDLRACSEGTIGETDQYSEQKCLQVERLIDRFRGREPFVSHVGFVANTNCDDSQLRNMTIQEYREEKDRYGD